MTRALIYTIMFYVIYLLYTQNFCGCKEYFGGLKNEYFNEASDNSSDDDDDELTAYATDDKYIVENMENDMENDMNDMEDKQENYKVNTKGNGFNIKPIGDSEGFN